MILGKSVVHPARRFGAAAVSLRGPAHGAHRGLGAYTQLCSICAQKESPKGPKYCYGDYHKGT